MLPLLLKILLAATR